MQQQRVIRGSKGLGNKIDPNKVAVDVTAALNDETLANIFRRLPPSPHPCSLVCKRWLRVQGLLRHSIKVQNWGFLEGGRMSARFPCLTEVDLTGASVVPPKYSAVLLSHQFLSIQLSPDAYDPSSIERFIQEQQLSPSSLDRGLKTLADAYPGLQKLSMVDVRRASYDRISFRRRESWSNSPNGTPTGTPESKDRQKGNKLVDEDVKKTLGFSIESTEKEIEKLQGSFQSLSLKSLFSDQGLAYVAKKCPMLQELKLYQCTDESLSAISACKNLQIVSLVGTVNGFYHCTFTDIGLTILARSCNRLVKLELSGCEASYDGIAAIGKCCVMLEELTLSNQGFYEGWIAALSFCSCLRTLRLVSCRQIDPIPGPLEHIGHCTLLEQLQLVRCNLRDRDGFTALAYVCSAVRELEFVDCWGLEDEIFSLTSICKHVKLLSLEGCSLLTTTGLEAVALTWKELQTLRVVYCNNIKDSEIGPELAMKFSLLKELKWRPDTKSLLSISLAGTGVGQKGGKFFKKGNYNQAG